jgi:ABC-type enterochelin transport system permease subunit
MTSFPKTTSPFRWAKMGLILITEHATFCNIHVYIYIYIYKNVLGCVITLPLFSRCTFKAYKMIPIAVTLGNRKFAYVIHALTKLGNTTWPRVLWKATVVAIWTVTSKYVNSNIHNYQAIWKNRVMLSCYNLEQKFSKIVDTRRVEIKNAIWLQLDNNEWL